MSSRDGSVPISINRRKFDAEVGPATGRQVLAIAGLGEGYDLFLLTGEGDPTGGQVILADQIVDIRPGMHFRAIPGNRTFGNDDIPAIWRADATRLGSNIEREVQVARSGAQLFAVVKAAQLPPATYTTTRSDVLLISDVQYPVSAMDMFWMEEPVKLADGTVPSHQSSIETYVGRRWRRWSWHRNGVWTPGVDDLLGHWAFVESCWAKEWSREPASV
ncbi:MAG: hypothetical protein IT300_18230 [Dehalococcoidia bacterium]|nr:hypothetical protein [Dehalococcoidia bacterium]